MSSRLPHVTADQAIRIVLKLGFAQVRQSGSHKVYRNPQGIRLTIPYHKGRVLHPKLVKALVHDLGLTSGQFIKLS